MELKKSPKANLENKKGLFLEIGLIISMACVIGAFASTQTERVVEVPEVVYEAVEEEIVELVREDDPRPLVAARQTVIVASEIINLVRDDQEISEDMVFEDFEEDAAMVTSIMQGRTEGPANDEPFLSVEQMPGFNGGGIEKFRNWVQTNVVYPKELSKMDVKGIVYVEFVVERDGSIGGVKILQSPHAGLSSEVEKVLKKSPKWTPGKQGNQAARVKFTLPVEFEISSGW